MRLIAGNNSKSDETFLPRTLLLLLMLLMLAVSVHLSPPALTSTAQRIRMQRTLCTARKGTVGARERTSEQLSLSLSLSSTDDDLVLFLNACHRAFSRTVTAAAVDAVVVVAAAAEEEEKEKETSKWAMLNAAVDIPRRSWW